MGISRIDKLIHESAGRSESLSHSTSSRSITFQILVGNETTDKAALMAHAAVSLALRSFTGPIHIYLGSARAAALYPGTQGLREELLELERRYGTSGRVKVVNGEPDGDLPTLRICQASGPGLLADAAGWISGINCALPAGVTAEIPAATFAVACVFARIFKATLLGRADDGSAWKFDVLNFQTVEGAPQDYTRQFVNLGKIGILGAGALGSAFSYVLNLSGWTAEADIIDFDFYEEPNHETSLLVGLQDVRQYPKKAERLAALLSERGPVKAKPIVTKITSQSAELVADRDFFICGVDNSETRRELDGVRACLLNAGVGGTAQDAGHVLLSRHLTADKRLSDIYPVTKGASGKSASQQNIPTDLQNECSRLQYESTSLAAPFIALASGSLLAASCAQKVLKIDVPVNYLKLDLFGVQAAMDARLTERVVMPEGLPVELVNETEIPALKDRAIGVPSPDWRLK